MQPVPSNAQRAESPDIILGGRVLFEVSRSEDTDRPPRSNLQKVGKREREITVIIEGCSNATNVMSSRGA